MKCPLRHRAQYYGSLSLPDSDDNCLKEECAWWNKFTEECSVYLLALETRVLRAAMQDIKNKMPHKPKL